MDKEFHAKFKEFRREAFPDNSSDDDIVSDFFMSLVEYDSFIAGYLDRIDKGEKIELSNLRYDDKLDQDLNKNLNRSDLKNEDKVALKNYLFYLRRIKDLILIARGN